MKGIKQRLVVLASLVSMPMVVAAQAPVPPMTPIDGGISILLAAGAAYGLKKMYKNKD